jgi:hypothetical protein
VDDRIVRLEATVEQLGTAIQLLGARIAALEARRPELAAPGEAPAGAGATAGAAQAASTGRATRDPYDPIAILSLIGRLFLVLAGGFFLRAMTEAGVLAPPVGVTLAFAYGLLWLFLADRAGRLAQVPNAVFHALGAAMVAFPLLVEATTRFKVVSGASSAIVITVLTSGLLYAAWRRRLHAVAWVTVVAALPTSLVLLFETGVMAPFALYLIALGVATLWLGYSLGWTMLRWPVALTADLVVVGVTLRALAPEHHDSPQVAMLLQLSLLGAYVVSIAIRTLVRGRNVVPFEVVQTAAALVVGFGGALYLARATGILPATLGIVSLVLGAASYGVAIAFIDRHEGLERNVYYYTTLALVLVLAGCTLVLHAPWLGVAFALLGVLGVGLWSRYGRLYLLLHGAAYLVAAGITSGALGYATRALLSGPAGPWAASTAGMIVVLVAGALSARFTAVRPSPEGGAFASGLRLVIVVQLVWIGSGCVTGWLAPVAAGLPDRSVDPGALATVRTVVLATATLLGAWLGRHARFREWAWLVYPLLVATGIKMIAQDFKDSRPATLFVALAVFGVALIVAPRLRRAATSRRAIAQST